MPAALPAPAHKRDVRVFDADYDFLMEYARRHNTTFNDLARELLHRYANDKRKALGLAPAPPL